jgi:hypothetical protein
MNEKPKQVFDVGHIIKKVDDLPPYLQFINNVCLLSLLNKVLKMHKNMTVFLA